jgi:hypothetical protein
LRAENQRLTRELAKSAAVVEIWENCKGSWNTSPRARTRRRRRGRDEATFTELRAVAVPINRSCALLGRARATHYRHTRGPVHGPRPARQVPENGQALSAAQRAAVLTLINTPAYADLAIGQIWARELDEGRYWCSASTMYRIARAAGQSRERRRLATHPAKMKPELLADGPSQVWTWDITKLRGPAKGSGSSSTC